jgi:hypothetical protein
VAGTSEWCNEKLGSIKWGNFLISWEPVSFYQEGLCSMEPVSMQYIIKYIAK